MPDKPISFEMGGVPVKVAASVYGKNHEWIRVGIVVGWLPIGVATRDGKRITNLDEMDPRLGRISYYISPLKLYQETGYIWNGKDNPNETDDEESEDDE